FAQRVHDILALAALARAEAPRPKEIALLGLGGTGPVAAVAIAQAPAAFTRGAVDLGGFRFAGLTDVYHIDFLPGAARYGDVPGFLALAAPLDLWLADGVRDGLEFARAAYEAAGVPHRLTEFTGDRTAAARAAVSWLARR